MSWIYLIVAGLFEVAFTSCMGKVKETTGSEMYWWFTGFIISMSISMFLLIKATQALPIGTAYAVWTGVSAVINPVKLIITNYPEGQVEEMEAVDNRKIRRQAHTPSNSRCR